MRIGITKHRLVLFILVFFWGGGGGGEREERVIDRNAEKFGFMWHISGGLNNLGAEQ